MQVLRLQEVMWLVERAGGWNLNSGSRQATLVLSFCKIHVSREIELSFNSHTVDLSKDSSGRTPRPGITDPNICPKLYSAQKMRGAHTIPQLSQTGTDTHSLPSWLLFKHSSHSKIIQALHRARDRYKFIPNVQRQDKWVTPEGRLCLPGAGHPPSALWQELPPTLQLSTPLVFSHSFNNHPSF